MKQLVVFVVLALLLIVACDSSRVVAPVEEPLATAVSAKPELVFSGVDGAGVRLDVYVYQAFPDSALFVYSEEGVISYSFGVHYRDGQLTTDDPIVRAGFWSCVWGWVTRCATNYGDDYKHFWKCVGSSALGCALGAMLVYIATLDWLF